MTTFSIGCDPEIFVKKHGRPASAHGMIQGTKESPLPVQGGAVQVDGMALEINTDPVSIGGLFGNFEAFNQNIISVIRELRSLVPDGTSFSLTPCMEFPEELMANLPPEAKELGCDPDYNAYTMEVNPRPDGNVNFRTAAGHIHIGWGSGIPVDSPDHHAICAKFVKYMDATVGVFMTIIEEPNKRRELYGKAGAYRPKHYGVEYRTPSNVWLKTKLYRQMIFELTKEAINFCKSKYFDESTFNLARQIINDGNVNGAKQFFDSFITQELTISQECRRFIINDWKQK